MILATDDNEREVADMSPDDARQILQAFCENGFDGSIEATALALGRDDDDIQDMLEGDEEVDNDLILKVRGIANERDIDIGIESAEGTSASG
jgi:hypothetical protein